MNDRAKNAWLLLCHWYGWQDGDIIAGEGENKIDIIYELNNHFKGRDALEEEFNLLKRKFKYFVSDDYDSYVHPCIDCEDYCYKNDDCKSNGGCGNKEIDDKIKRLEEENKCYGEVYSECEMYKKALDKLSETLQGVDGLSAKEWKELALRGVSEGL